MASKIAVRILEAAVECFAEKGFAGCSTKEIAIRADVTEGSVFRLFHSKELLFDEAIRHALRLRIQPEEVAEILAKESDFARSMRRIWLLYFDRLSDPYVRMMSFALLERPDLIEEVFSVVGRVNDLLQDRLADEYKARRIRNGEHAREAILGLSGALFQLRMIGTRLPHLRTKKDLRAAAERMIANWIRSVGGSKSALNEG